MDTSTPKLRRTFVSLTVATLAVFGALVFGQAFRLRQPLHDEVLKREAESIRAVVQMQIGGAEKTLEAVKLPLTTNDVFNAVLESSRLQGVVNVQLFDPAGVLRESYPAIASDAAIGRAWWPNPLTDATARLHPNGSLEEIFGLPPQAGTVPTEVPLLEVVVPLTAPKQMSSLGVARYWIVADSVAAELRHLDRSLFTQAAIAFAAGAVLLIALVVWTYRRLAEAQRQLVDQSADLARANQELDFAAKTGALGAISAHLIHGLKNPLAGLEGFVSEAADEPVSGQARQTAMETARRLRTLVNDVVAVLRDEKSGEADYPVPLAEAVEAVENRMAPLAASAGVTLAVELTGKTELKARIANLAGLVLANLVSNAVEASPRGAEVRLDAHADRQRVEFVVTDQGRGLPEAVRASLFRPVRSAKPGGGGMGLAISHRLARHAGGELSLVRTSETGTAFRLIVPAA